MGKVGIIGAGAYGTALAQSLSCAGREVVIWAREDKVVEEINRECANSLYLPGVVLDEKIRASGDIDYVCNEADILLMVTPAQYLRATLKRTREHLEDGGKVFVVCSKGIEMSTGKLLSDVVAEEVPGASYAIMSGPTFAAEIARGLPSAVTVATEKKSVAEEVVGMIGHSLLRTYVSDDVIGAQIGGAVKNVIAIACGIIKGKRLGEGAAAALVTRGLAEMNRLNIALGGRPETLMEMCGIGDMILTCSSEQSRNFSLGLALGQGMSMEEFLKDKRSVTEGVFTARALEVMAGANGVEMPISHAVHRCVNENANLDDVIRELQKRPLRV